MHRAGGSAAGARTFGIRNELGLRDRPTEGRYVGKFYTSFIRAELARGMPLNKLVNRFWHGVCVYGCGMLSRRRDRIVERQLPAR